MEEGRSRERRRCPAMIEAGIDDPNSQNGIEFCLHCPYPRCIAFEDGRSRATLRREKKAAKAKDMLVKGFSNEEIAQALKVGLRTVIRYLRC